MINTMGIRESVKWYKIHHHSPLSSGTSRRKIMKTMLSRGQDIVRLLFAFSDKTIMVFGIHVLTGLPACDKTACFMTNLLKPNMTFQDSPNSLPPIVHPRFLSRLINIYSYLKNKIN